jgi:hypothetical protein
MSERKPDVVEFYVTTTVKHVVDVDAYATAVAEQGDGWLTRASAAVKTEIPEDRPHHQLTAVALYAEGEFIAEYDVDNPDVEERVDRDAIVIAAMGATIEIPDTFAAMPVRLGQESPTLLFISGD